VTSTAEDHSLGHHQLAYYLSAEFAGDVLNEAAHVDRDAVRCLVLRSVLNGRVTGLLHVQRIKPDQIKPWLVDYVNRVQRIFCAERSQWQALLSVELPRDDDPLIPHIATAAEVAYRGIRTKFAHVAIEFDELVNQTFVALRIERGLIDYPFDSPLNVWLRRCVWQSAQQLYGESEHIVQWSIDDTEAGNQIVDPISIVDRDDHLALITALGAMIDADRQIINDAANGVHAETTARTLGISRATVYARRQRLYARLRKLL
jgi:DNA-directed RNA polymerase specialized sigma24 family protein